MINDLAIAKRQQLVLARRAYQETGKAGIVEISVRSGANWLHYVYQYDPVTDSLIQDKHE